MRDGTRPGARFDALFRVAGAITILLLAITGAMLLFGGERWAVPFLLAHLSALVALVPLGSVLVVHAIRRHGLMGAIRAHRGVAVILGVIVVTVAVSLLNFEDGIRWLRRVANLATVALVLVLVGRYWRWRRSAEQA